LLQLDENSVGSQTGKIFRASFAQNLAQMRAVVTGDIPTRVMFLTP
jgi:hypothetical protein